MLLDLCVGVYRSGNENINWCLVRVCRHGALKFY